MDRQRKQIDAAFASFDTFYLLLCIDSHPPEKFVVEGMLPLVQLRLQKRPRVKHSPTDYRHDR